MKKTYLFDFDGTLVDSMPTYGSVMLRIAEECGLTPSKELLKTVTPLGYRGAAEHYRSLGATRSVDEMVSLMGQYMQQQYRDEIGAKEGVVETLLSLKAEGASLNVLTASPHSALDCCLKRLGLWELFNHVWSCEDFSTTKSDPAIYVMAATKLGCPVGSVIFVDDNLDAIRTAKRAGMTAYAIYDSSSEDYREEMKATAHRYLNCFSELLN